MQVHETRHRLKSLINNAEQLSAAICPMDVHGNARPIDTALIEQLRANVAAECRALTASGELPEVTP